MKNGERWWSEKWWKMVEEVKNGGRWWEGVEYLSEMVKIERGWDSGR